jgi:uncharacterized protein YqiB (DUF1249 family)
MELNIKKVENYFINKIISGEYKVVEVCDYTLKLTIDNEYKFVLWVANEKVCLRTYDEGNYMRLDFSSSDQEQSWAHIQKHRNKYYEETQRAKDLKELEVLTKRLNKKQ